MAVVRPCIERLPDGRGCPRYALPGKSRCQAHQREAMAKRDLSPGTTPAWARARRAALERDGWRCTACGKTQAQAKADSPAGKGLEVHHRSGAGVRAETHVLEDLVTLCRACHLDTLRAKSRPTLDEYKAQIMERARARRAAAGQD